MVSSLLVALLLTPPGGGALQFVPRPDSLVLHREARSAQTRFERVRLQHLPPTWWSSSGPCDETVGRFCVRFSGSDREEVRERELRWTPVGEPPEIEMAREELLATLAHLQSELPGDDWIAGQRVTYLLEEKRPEEALEAARSCRGTLEWCGALTGMVLHESQRFAESEAVFRAALELHSVEERLRLLDPVSLLQPASVGWMRRGSEEERGVRAEAFWRASNPLFLLGGNPLLTEHLSRHTLAVIREDAMNPHTLRWGNDLTELLVRYGPVRTFRQAREIGPARSMSPPSVVGYYDPAARNLLPSDGALRTPRGSEPGDWPTDLQRTRSRHTIPGIFRIFPMEAQVARFRRGDSMYLVVAWRAPEPGPPHLPDTPDPWEPHRDQTPAFPPANGSSGLFLLPLDSAGTPADRPTLAERAGGLRSAEGVFTLRGSTTAYLLSAEFLDSEGGRAWRHRQGVELSPARSSEPELSDLLLLQPAPQVPTPQPGDVSLESLLPRALPSLRVPQAPVEVLWEMYGLSGDVGEIQVHMSLRRENAGFFRRAGEFLRLVQPDPPVEVRWSEGVDPDGLRAPGGGYLRSTILDLTGIPEGGYRLTLAVTFPGGEVRAASRAVEVGPHR